ncbi:Myotrophin [Trichoplax sp. H2]|uniref:Uncharacterized protein n=1 Tax=Trichoplax adhaerens TaxID=10228 RepID=B3RVY3_TRIAD|nr:hypothetical protein TRIADDRAFT_24456 [Trichoplax adhaerens]EDV26079.1 hypothetical protein TRIADDRAFT_24456 [Trichoplax adhaerens]RDD43067.1 Myotrophin [Trichoplax sp. H2]|eukprot:XP_002112112.1 hypothetical protein TRIADDRAFT_24456 [Trichoplax adhaerens]
MSDNLIWAIKNGDLEAVKMTISSQNIDVNGQLQSGRMPLHYAADYGQAKVMDYLLDQGANINQLDKHGISPLLAAIWEGHTNCVKLLIDRGADKNAKAPSGNSYIQEAESQEIRQLLA